MNCKALMAAAAGTAALLAIGALGVGPAMAAGSFAGLEGSWSGSGTAHFEGGQSEQLRCVANYRTSGGGGALSLSLRCASGSANIDLHGNVSASGRGVSGSWEERATGIGGGVGGSAEPGHLHLHFSGGASGSLNVSLGHSSQSVSITSHGTSLRSVSMSLGRR
jgi:hypothetical protein